MPEWIASATSSPLARSRADVPARAPRRLVSVRTTLRNLSTSVLVPKGTGGPRTAAEEAAAFER